MRLEFTNLHFDGPIKTRWDEMLRIVGDFTLWVGNERYYGEVDFCLVEFALALAAWLSMATDLGPNFIYTSMESDTDGLVRFTLLTPGKWQISAAHEVQPAGDVVTIGELNGSAVAFLSELRSRLLPQLDILQLLDDAKVHENIRRRLRLYEDQRPSQFR